MADAAVAKKILAPPNSLGGFKVVELSDGKYYKGERVNEQESVDIGRIVNDFLDEKLKPILVKYGLSTRVAGSLNNQAVVRNNRIEDFDLEIVEGEDSHPCPIDKYIAVQADMEFWDACLAFLDTATDPMMQLGSYLTEHGIEFKWPNFNIFTGMKIEGHGAIGFILDRTFYNKRFCPAPKTQ
ncbi:hypothetical protein A2Y99_03325 [Candidatus Gottesmanbacteria bacterium RBG_13_37_7]|uniref:Uncharacterized protein n=1 Tax=Candidatus Gottesmanbacteria bacterium RBG_13_37_7 TaxID=1798369 RepID=A0A1F5YJ75_9BACT|nr:MAG: hypothetical protein A2Y99_03325 [Candidatus Gottesmanbacteria bacterium RBG_13_37_7]